MSDKAHSTWYGRLFRRLLALMLLAGAAGGVVFGFLEGRAERAIEAQREQPVEAPLRVSMIAGEPTITLDAEAQRSSGLLLAPVQSASRREQLQAYGTVLDLQTLTELNNGFTNARAQIQTARTKVSASRTAYERAQRLYQDQQNISAAQFQAAEAIFRVDESNLAAAEVELQNLAASAIQQWGAVIGGALVNRTPILSRLLARQEVLIQVTVPPGSSLADPPQTASAQSSDSKSVTIQFVSPAPRTDSRIQGVSFLYSASAGNALQPGMNLVVLVDLGQTAEQAAVPASAIVWSEGRAWAYFRTGEQTFARREIATAAPAPDGGYFVAGLPADAQIVAQGAQMLLSEEFRAQIQVGEE